MMSWSQDYDPLHAWYISTLVSALPVVTLFFVLVVLRARVWIAALAGFLMAVVLALIVFGMPAPLVAAAGGLGVIFGLLRIAWVIVASIFLYNI
ncbi:MAG TPA: L-lactate permease, partial [Isosphaeraceae bacterium]|nr:L-lactate permease [Isosphaeraceae bacterium]